MTDPEIKQKIIFTTIQLIEEVGLKNVTVRMISEKANVNIAAINYHFRNKDNLISIVLEQTLKEAFENNIKDNFNDQSNPLNSLRQYLKDNFEGSFNYPRITKAHFYKSFVDQKYDSELIDRFNELLTFLFSKTSNSIRGEDETEKRMHFVHIIAVSFLYPMFSNFFEDFLQLNMSEEVNQSQFLDLLLESNIEEN